MWSINVSKPLATILCRERLIKIGGNERLCGFELNTCKLCITFLYCYCHCCDHHHRCCCDDMRLYLSLCETGPLAGPLSIPVVVFGMSECEAAVNSY